MAQTYREYSLLDVWHMLAAEDPEAGFTHVNALNRLRVALEQQRDNLRAQRNRLSSAWPPDRSEAALAFASRLNEMIDVTTYTAEAAARICNGIDQVFAAVREARRELEPLVASYSTPAGTGFFAANADYADLDRRARDILIAADAKVVGASDLINTEVPHYARFQDSPTELKEPSTGGTAAVGSTDGSAGGHTSAGSAQSALLSKPTFDPPRPTAGGPAPGTEPAGRDHVAGPVLTGATSGPPPSSGTAPGGPSSHPAGPIGNAVWERSGAVHPIIGPGGVIGEPRSSLPAGGGFGGAPTTGIGFRPGPSRAPQREAAVRPPASPERGIGGALGAYRDRSYEAYVERRRTGRGNDNELWPVEEGVPPVIEAPVERHHDPGPGVLGIDR